MKTFLLVFLLALLCTERLQGQDFRDITWGMTVEQVKALEGLRVLDENESMFVYAVEVAGRDALLFYKHADGKVFRGGYSFQVKHDDKNGYIDDYEALKAQLTEEYGWPISDEVVWKNDLYRQDLDQHGLAVGMGYLIYWADWSAGDTRIELALHGNNDLHVLAMNYASVTHSESSEGQ